MHKMRKKNIKTCSLRRKREGHKKGIQKGIHRKNSFLIPLPTGYRIKQKKKNKEHEQKNIRFFSHLGTGKALFNFIHKSAY